MNDIHDVVRRSSFCGTWLGKRLRLGGRERIQGDNLEQLNLSVDQKIAENEWTSARTA